MIYVPLLKFMNPIRNILRGAANSCLKRRGPHIFLSIVPPDFLSPFLERSIHGCVRQCNYKLNVQRDKNASAGRVSALIAVEPQGAGRISARTRGRSIRFSRPIVPLHPPIYPSFAIRQSKRHPPLSSLGEESTISRLLCQRRSL